MWIVTELAGYRVCLRLSLSLSLFTPRDQKALLLCTPRLVPHSLRSYREGTQYTHSPINRKPLFNGYVLNHTWIPFLVYQQL